MCIESSMNRPLRDSNSSETTRNSKSIPVSRVVSAARLILIIFQLAEALNWTRSVFLVSHKEAGKAQMEGHGFPSYKQSAVEHFDVIIVGAGLSGIGGACHLKRHCPGKSFVVLEGRAALG